ncbi:hypothetical protein GN244_ATG17126 [Phytophthora infestans]|uniref:Uncharacterized protein n=1 Tax=Phytophthora infestans TaxID=4787 RepID=A0A833SZE7_PHYIN|nr:hypothetical protein GN244_ATG17126 [Phytophthora infestans]
MLLKKCKYFYDMDEIFGSRHNMVPPFVLEPNAAVLNGQVYTRSSTTVTMQTPGVTGSPVRTQAPTMVSTSTVSTSPSPAVVIASIVSSPPRPAAAAVISTPAAADSSTPTLAPRAAAVNSTPTTATSVASILPVPTAANALQAAVAGDTALMGPAECMNVSEYFPVDSSLTTRSPTTKLGSKRVYNDSPGSSVAKLLAQIRDERDTTRAERHNEEMSMRRDELELKRQQFEAYKFELILKEQKI